MSTQPRAPTPTGSRRPPTGRTAAAAALNSHPLRGRSATRGAPSPTPPSFRGTPTHRSREASPLRLPSPLHATADPGLAAVHDEIYPPPPAASAGAHVSSLEQYREMYERSLADPEGFWGELASEFHWETPWEAGNFMR